MDFGLIALALTVAHIVLSYVAPRTKTKYDDYARDAVGVAKTALPNAKTPSPAAPVAKQVEGFGMARDHRSK
jgi:hypothetical protein